MDGSPINRKAETDALVERMARALVLAEALDRAEPHDADTLASAWVADHMTGGPTHTLACMIDNSASWWAQTAPRVEVAAYVRAGLQELAASALAPAMRKALIAALWNGLSADDKRSFIARVAGQ